MKWKRRMNLLSTMPLNTVSPSVSLSSSLFLLSSVSLSSSFFLLCSTSLFHTAVWRWLQCEKLSADTQYTATWRSIWYIVWKNKEETGVWVSPEKARRRQSFSLNRLKEYRRDCCERVKACRDSVSRCYFSMSAFTAVSERMKAGLGHAAAAHVYFRERWKKHSISILAKCCLSRTYNVVVRS